MSAPLKTVIVGFGGVARGFADDPLMTKWFPCATHAQALRDRPEFELIGVVDPNADARAAAERDWRVPAVADVAAAAKAFDPNVLVLAAPPGARTEALAAFPNVKGVMAEKPLHGADGEKLVALAAERRIPLQVHFWRRGDPTHREMAAGGLVETVGEPQAVFGLYGNGLANNGSHLIDAARYLLGEPVSVQAMAPAVDCPGAPIAGDRHVPFALGFRGGFAAAMQPLDFRRYREVALDVWGSMGRVAFQQESLAVRTYPVALNRGLTDAFEIDTDKPTELPCRVGESLLALYENLADAIQGGATLWSDGANALRTDRIVATVLKSADEGGRRIEL